MHVQMCECECVQKTKHANVKVCRQVDGWYSALRNVASESTFAVGKKFPPNLGFFWESGSNSIQILLIEHLMVMVIGLVRSPHHSDQMSQRSQVSRVALCMSKVKVPWVSEWVSEWVTRSPIELFWTAKNIMSRFNLLRVVFPSFKVGFHVLSKHPPPFTSWLEKKLLS